MRHYDRHGFRHLNDSQRYRDLDYLGDDAWIGPNETVPHGLTTQREPPWWTEGPWERRAFAAQRAFDEDRGQGRQYGHDLGLGYGRAYDPRRTGERGRRDPYDRRVFEGGPPRTRRLPDFVLAREVRAWLEEELGREADDVGIEVEDGVVTLFGVVEDVRVRYFVEDVVHDVPGVLAVRSRLRVRTIEDTRIGGSRQWTGSGWGSTGAGRR